MLLCLSQGYRYRNPRGTPIPVGWPSRSGGGGGLVERDPYLNEMKLLSKHIQQKADIF
jgi:hypothetical protein